MHGLFRCLEQVGSKASGEHAEDDRPDTPRGTRREGTRKAADARSSGEYASEVAVRASTCRAGVVSREGQRRRVVDGRRQRLKNPHRREQDDEDRKKYERRRFPGAAVCSVLAEGVQRARKQGLVAGRREASHARQQVRNCPPF